MNIDTEKLETTIARETFKAVLELSAKQNTSFANAVDTLLRKGLEETYKKHPHMKPHGNDSKVEG